MAPEMDAPGLIRAIVDRRLMAMWLLALFSLAQAVPVVALAATDGMAGMACCKHGRDSCCRRKPMKTAPSFRAGHPCGLPCSGMPTVSPQAGAAVLPLLTPVAFGLPETMAERVLPGSVLMAAGYDAARFQRPPPRGV